MGHRMHAARRVLTVVLLHFLDIGVSGPSHLGGLSGVSRLKRVSIPDHELHEEKIKELASKKVPVREECPKDDDHKSFVMQGMVKKELVFVNANLVPVRLLWVGYHGEEHDRGVMNFGEKVETISDPGHVFNFRLVSNDKLIGIFRVPAFDLPSKLLITPCKGMEDDPSTHFKYSRWPAFEKLASGSDLGCLGPSHIWSCIRQLSPEEVSQRRASDFGVQVAQNGYAPGDTRAARLDLDQMRLVHNFTDFDRGYLKMKMPEKLREKLIPWYEERSNSFLQKHEGVMHANHDEVDIHLVDLHESYTLNMSFVRHAVINEVQEILQWWTGIPLRHTKTMGAQVYRRDAMLLSHLDNKRTQLVSAVLVLSQKVDENGGWPFEITHPLRAGVTEVYLQPGEMLLYEGARLLHGRPMRLKGDEYVTVFSHFAPISWRGPDDERPNPHYPEDNLHGAEL
eukprot:TRINITY_DN106648_c0_g1_i1.p1 TRINITY_DN106648_c0_g1~~TRINITY_DN106648_c0_g1_i1.p1  ORF type:complete len:453 (+),score=65.28 TRINITY_DN106648_c0_g1_i1:64-1422(+)